MHTTSELPTTPDQQSPQAGSPGIALWRVLRVRLRFVVILVVVGLIVGNWDVMQTHFDRWIDRFVAVGTRAHGVSADTEYFCPMCPGVLSNWPDTCPVCFMPLVRRQKGEAVLLPEGVTARMQFSPQQIQLAGIRTVVVEPQPLRRSLSSVGTIVSPPLATDSEASGEAAEANSNRDETMLYVDIPISPSDQLWLRPGQTASVSRVASSDSNMAELVALRVEGRASHRATFRIMTSDPDYAVGDAVRVTCEQPLAKIKPYDALAKDDEVLAIPESAVLDSGEERYVFVESMPGMFDGIPVRLGERSGEWYPVLDGLEAGQRIAARGAFLIDAETRLNSNVKEAYFGAGSSAAASASPAPARKLASKKKNSKTVRELLAEFDLSEADRAAAEKQERCPITNMLLGSMGEPIRVMVVDKPIFLCCEGCRSELEERGQLPQDPAPPPKP